MMKKQMTLKEYIQDRVNKGGSLEAIRADLLKDLEEGGPIFGEFKKGLQPTFVGSTRRFRDTGELARTGISSTFKFSLTKSKKFPGCPNCLALDGQVKTVKEWEKLGLSVYGKCKCENKCMYSFISAEAIPISPDE